MNPEQLSKLDPKTVKSVTTALRSTIDFLQGRGAMLRSLTYTRSPALAALLKGMGL